MTTLSSSVMYTIRRASAPYGIDLADNDGEVYTRSITVARDMLANIAGEEDHQRFIIVKTEKVVTIVE